jgi:DNA topoisomerase I
VTAVARRARGGPPRALDPRRDIELRYVSDEPGITRRRRGRGFGYVDAEGRRITDRTTLARIRSLAIPPAWSAVWICADERGHIQATGRDARGRKQYRYHPAWTRLRDETKFERLFDFGEALPRIRRAVKAALASDGAAPLDRDRVIASVVSLLDSTVARVGNREYRRDNGSFGLTTLESRHARKEGGQLRLVFRGKSGVRHELDIHDPRVAAVVRRCQSLPGQRLFQYLDESGDAHGIESQDVNAWLRQAANAEVTAKDFRTWHGSVLAFDRLSKVERPDEMREIAAAELSAVDEVALRLANTRAVCRKHYIHPALFAAFERGDLYVTSSAPSTRRARGWSARELRFLAWLESTGTAPDSAASETLPRAI